MGYTLSVGKNPHVLNRPWGGATIFLEDGKKGGRTGKAVREPSAG